MGQAEAANLLVGGLAIFAQMLRGLQAGVTMRLQEIEEVVALDKIQLARLPGLGRDLIGRAGNRGVHAQNFSRLRNLQDEGLAFCGSGRKLDAAFAQHVDSARRLAFHKKHRARGIRSCVLDVIKSFERGFGERAEEAVRTQLADYTILNQLKAVRRSQRVPSGSTSYAITFADISKQDFPQLESLPDIPLW